MTNAEAKSLQDRIITNAARTGHGSHIAALAAALLGVHARSLCCDCAEHVSGRAVRIGNNSECDRCREVGRDVLLVFPDAEDMDPGLAAEVKALRDRGAQARAEIAALLCGKV